MLQKILLENISQETGVYIFKDKFSNIIYVGKAKNLKKRITSYFQKNHSSPKTQVLVKNIENFETIILRSEVEALLVENQLIKKHKPKYNICLKDDKTYSYLKITDEKIPKLLHTRKVVEDGFFFGPYTSVALRDKLIFLCRKLFGIITKKSFSQNSSINFEIGLAPAKNINLIDEKKYLKNVEIAKKFLSGKNFKQIKLNLEKKMKLEANKKNFESAKSLRDLTFEIENLKKEQFLIRENFNQDILVFKDFDNKINVLIFSIIRGVLQEKNKYVFDKSEHIHIEFIKRYYGTKMIPKEILTNLNFFKNENEKKIILKYLKKLRGSSCEILVPKIGEKKSLIDFALKNFTFETNKIPVLTQLKNSLNLKTNPKIIECFDISNLGSDYVVGAMTRFENLKQEKSLSLKFEIKSFKKKQDDFRAISEVVYRRYRKLKKETNIKKIDFPNLILIDGGKGQLNSALFSLKLLNLKIPIISLAKREEEIYLQGKLNPLKFDKNCEMMLSLRKMRDSVHNFVISYNRKKRQMRMREEFDKKTSKL